MKVSRLLNQTAVYWGTPTNDGYGGKSFAPGIEIDVRWEDKAVRFIDAAGEEVLSRSLVWVNQDLVTGAYLFLGTLNDLTSAAEDDPTQEHEAYEIRQVEKVPDVKGSVFLRKVVL